MTEEEKGRLGWCSEPMSRERFIELTRAAGDHISDCQAGDLLGRAQAALDDVGTALADAEAVNDNARASQRRRP